MRIAIKVRVLFYYIAALDAMNVSRRSNAIDKNKRQKNEGRVFAKRSTLYRDYVITGPSRRGLRRAEREKLRDWRWQPLATFNFFKSPIQAEDKPITDPRRGRYRSQRECEPRRMLCTLATII